MNSDGNDGQKRAGRARNSLAKSQQAAVERATHVAAEAASRERERVAANREILMEAKRQALERLDATDLLGIQTIDIGAVKRIFLGLVQRTIIVSEPGWHIYRGGVHKYPLGDTQLVGDSWAVAIWLLADGDFALSTWVHVSPDAYYQPQPPQGLRQPVDILAALEQHAVDGIVQGLNGLGRP